MCYIHTNLIARDWKALSRFYQSVFGCKPIGAKRDLSGPWIEQLTGIPNVQIEGEHLAFPGYESGGPTLEIFTYSSLEDSGKSINKSGFAHIAFEVEDVKQSAELLIKNGGSLLGEIVSKEYDEMGTGTFVYAKDPEGNFIELQSWGK